MEIENMIIVVIAMTFAILGIIIFCGYRNKRRVDAVIEYLIAFMRGSICHDAQERFSEIRALRLSGDISMRDLEKYGFRSIEDVRRSARISLQGYIAFLEGEVANLRRELQKPFVFDEEQRILRENALENTWKEIKDLRGKLKLLTDYSSDDRKILVELKPSGEQV